MFWQITSFPQCEHHVFLSHSAEDRRWLVHPLIDRLATSGVQAWLDRDQYPYGRPSLPALRHGLLTCRHVAVFVTEAMLRSPRGWTAAELAYTDLLQANYTTRGGTLLNVALPLFFLDPADAAIWRSVWSQLRDSGRFHRPEHGDATAWAFGELLAFLRREQRYAADTALHVARDNTLASDLATCPGLRQRVTEFGPSEI